MNKERLDVLLVEKGLAPSRERAKSYIMAGMVLVDGQKVDKAGTLVSPIADLTITGDNIGYVSRGGLKLAKAIETFTIDIKGKTVADIGASTGGFTDCVLKNGAAKVYAIDVGYGQLAWSLRNDRRVINMERVNVRNLTPDDIGELLDFITVDVSFISLEKVLPVVRQLLKVNSSAVVLIKPQFEAGREKVGKRGVVKDPEVHIDVINKIVEFGKGLGLFPLGLTYSPITGPEGNIEYLLYLLNQPTENSIDCSVVGQVVRQAHANLAG